MKASLLTGVLALFLLHPTSSWAFPELTRHGYTYCTACHISPSGGGLLSQYGRELSKEVLSTWGKDGEQRFLEGWVNTEAWDPFLAGGDFRLIQIFQDTAFASVGRLFTMQLEGEFGYRPGKFTFDVTLGRILDSDDTTRFGTHRFFAGYSFSDELSVRAGQFYPMFGLNIPEHVFGTRAGMGFDEGQETRNIEVNWSEENWSVVGTAAFAQDDALAKAQNRRGAGVLQVTRALGTDSRAGVSTLVGGLDGNTYKAAALHGIFGITHEFFVMAEFDWKWVTASGTTTSTDARYAKIGYEAYKGVVPYLFHEHLSAANGWGGGVQWFPRPHFELHGMIEKVFSTLSQSGGDTTAWLLFHYYF